MKHYIEVDLDIPVYFLYISSRRKRAILTIVFILICKAFTNQSTYFTQIQKQLIKNFHACRNCKLLSMTYTSKMYIRIHTHSKTCIQVNKGTFVLINLIRDYKQEFMQTIKHNIYVISFLHFHYEITDFCFQIHFKQDIAYFISMPNIFDTINSYINKHIYLVCFYIKILYYSVISLIIDFLI